MKKNKENKKGAVMMIVTIFFLIISMVIITGFVPSTITDMGSVTKNMNSKKAYFLTESGIEDSVYRIITNMNINPTETLTLDGNTATININTIGNQKEIVSIGDISNYQRKINTSLNAGVGVSFNYGVQVGQGGIDLQGSSGINGNVYANGPITGSTSSFISGSAISANSPALNANQSNGDGTPGYDISFRDTSSTQDIAQSFQISDLSPLNKVQLYVRKNGNPGSATVKIVNNSGGSPGTVSYATGTLATSSVGTSYGWVDVSFNTNPLLNLNTTYWLVVDSSSNSSSNYFRIGASNGGYNNGVGKIGQQGGVWNNTSPSGLDYFFKIYLGGVNGLIAGSSGSQWNQLSVGTSGSGIAHAHTINYTETPDDIFCQTGTGNNKSCDTSEPDPVYISYPISEANITQWKNEAETGGTVSGDYNTPSYGNSIIGPKKITGNLTVTGSHTLYISGTLWVQGNITVDGSAKIVLNSSYGSNSGVIVSDGWLNLVGSGQLNGSGQVGSYILFVTTSNCDISFCSYNAINISGAAGSVILNAQNGTISFSGSASAKEAVGHKMVLTGNTRVNYESGLVNVNFTSGPSGRWNIGGWKETE